MNLTYRSSVKSHAGNVRELNEDAFFSCEEKKIWCLADGMGGYDAGEVASSMVVDAVAAVTPVADLKDSAVLVCDALMQANREMTHQRLGCDSMMGSTVLVLLASEAECACIWAGDSRLYLYRDASLFQMSKDHSVVQELIDKGVIPTEEACQHPQSHVITRAVGADKHLDLEVIYFELQAGDVLLLCSDGLYSELTPDDIMHVLSLPGDSAYKVSELIEKTLQQRASDNVTVSVIEVNQ
ncbi:MAG: protein phosphatase 2C domain-containing protein [Ketobacter sp.]|uniref:PP2C family protein-serine/threonine phosphatase n=1 Tax=Ketobacter sp. MCCC 1A13808 TaxID=2602738 RepID=UPI0018DE250B|nr:protein phosphatase 2C domain-containing protein [Ketobacter sp. MCCC 1A13808]